MRTARGGASAQRLASSHRSHRSRPRRRSSPKKTMLVAASKPGRPSSFHDSTTLRAAATARVRWRPRAACGSDRNQWERRSESGDAGLAGCWVGPARPPRSRRRVADDDTLKWTTTIPARAGLVCSLSPVSPTTTDRRLIPSSSTTTITSNRKRGGPAAYCGLWSALPLRRGLVGRQTRWWKKAGSGGAGCLLPTP